MLQWLYCGAIPAHLSLSASLSLIELASEYLVPDLVDECVALFLVKYQCGCRIRTRVSHVFDLVSDFPSLICLWTVFSRAWRSLPGRIISSDLFSFAKILMKVLAWTGSAARHSSSLSISHRSDLSSAVMGHPNR